MKKKLLVLFTLLLVLMVALSVASMCYAEETEDAPEETTDAVVEEDFDFWTWAKDTWARTKEAVNVSFSAIVGAIVIVVIKRATNKGFDKIEEKTDANNIADKTTTKLLSNLADTKLEVDIKPLMAQEYAQLGCELKADINKRDAKQDKMNQALIEIAKALGNFYKNSVAISDEQKDAFDKAIAEAEALCVVQPTISAKIEVKAEAEKEDTITENY